MNTLFVVGLIGGMLVSIGILVGAVTMTAIRPQVDPPPNACHEAATTLYGHVGAMLDEITQQALIKGSYTAGYVITSDGEVFPRVWYDFVQACVPPPPIEGGGA